MKSKLFILGALVGTLITTTSCSYFNKKPDNTTTEETSRALSLPPALKKPQSRASVSVAKKIQKPAIKTSRTIAAPSVIIPGKDYYIVVGTYPDNDQALDMFIKMSSLGFSNTAMETRKTPQGLSLHMVRLGPFNNQESIDKTRDTLSKAGMTQFKVVKK